MASERGYDVRTAPSAGPGPVLADPRDYGAQLGQALDQFGQAKHGAEIRAYQIERQQKAASEASAWGSASAQYRTNVDQQIAALRQTSKPGGEGHIEAVKAVYQAGRDSLLAGITEDRVRQQAAAQFDENMAATISRESLWAAGQDAARKVVDNATADNLSTNRIRTNPTNGVFAEELKTRLDQIASLPVEPDVRDKLATAYQQQAHDSFIRGLVDQGQFDTARGLLKTDEYAGVLTPAQRGNLQNDIDVEDRRAKGMQQQEQAAAIAGAREQAATLREKAGHVPLSDAEVAQAAALREQFKAIGDTSSAEQLQNVVADNMFARQYEGQLPIQMQNRLSELKGKASLSDSEQREAAWLPAQIKARAEMFRADSKSFFIQYGGPNQVPPPFDITDPGSVKATVDWKRKMTAATGADVQLLTREQAEQLAGEARKGGQQRMQMLGLLDRFPDAERDRVAQQMLPGDAGFRQEAQIHPEARAFVFEGRDVLKGDRRFLTPDKDRIGADTAAALMRTSHNELQVALAGIPAVVRTAIDSSSGEWLAGWLSKHGRDVNSVTPWDIKQAATYALGGGFQEGTRQKGGIAHARDGQPFVLPDTMSDFDFWHNVERDRAAKASKGLGPAMMLQNAHPVWIGRTANGDQYRWETIPPPGANSGPRIVLDANHDHYITTVRAGQ